MDFHQNKTHTKLTISYFQYDTFSSLRSKAIYSQFSCNLLRTFGNRRILVLSKSCRMVTEVLAEEAETSGRQKG